MYLDSIAHLLLEPHLYASNPGTISGAQGDLFFYGSTIKLNSLC